MGTMADEQILEKAIEFLARSLAAEAASHAVTKARFEAAIAEIMRLREQAEAPSGATVAP